MIKVRTANLLDISEIQRIEKEYYNGFNCPYETLKNWIEKSENFIVAEVDKEIAGFVFFEYLSEIKDLPFVHEFEYFKDGKFAYISEIGVLKKFQDFEVLQKLFEFAVSKIKIDGKKVVIWLTGEKMKHDKIEKKLLIKNNFEEFKKVTSWECFPGVFVHDHALWIKKLSP